MNPFFSHFQKLLLRPWPFRWFLATHMPLGLFMGLRLIQFQSYRSQVTVPFKKLNQNHLNGLHFAVLSMAAELSTSVMAFGQVYKREPKIIASITRCEGQFYKKATDKITFTCQDGKLIETAVEKALKGEQNVMIQCTAVGNNTHHEMVAAFTITWSFKVA
jgi:Domain of unknown function (DUF4442)